MGYSVLNLPAHSGFFGFADTMKTTCIIVLTLVTNEGIK